MMRGYDYLIIKCEKSRSKFCLFRIISRSSKTGELGEGEGDLSKNAELLSDLTHITPD